MINRNISVHLQDFPDVSFLNDNQDLVADMDLVRAICSTALSIRDNKNLRVRLPLNELKVIGKNAARILPFKEIIAEEVNVKNVVIEENIDNFAELKLQINFKKIGVKYGSKVKEIMACVKNGEWRKIGEKAISIAGLELQEDEFELKLTTKNNDDKKFVVAPLATNDCLVSLDVEVTQNLLEEGVARDVVRAIQQNRKTANFNVSDRISIVIFSSNKMILQVVQNFSNYIKEQVLATSIVVEYDVANVEKLQQNLFSNKIDDGELTMAIAVI